MPATGGLDTLRNAAASFGPEKLYYETGGFHADGNVAYSYERLNEAFRAVLVLLRNRQYTLLNLIDPSGACASGEASPLYAALCLLRYQRARKEERRQPATLSPELVSLMREYAAGSTNIKDAARRAGMDTRRFKALYECPYGGTVRKRGRPAKAA